MLPTTQHYKSIHNHALHMEIRLALAYPDTIIDNIYVNRSIRAPKWKEHVTHQNQFHDNGIPTISRFSLLTR